jgi:3-dehydroquinate synthase
MKIRIKNNFKNFDYDYLVGTNILAELLDKVAKDYFSVIIVTDSNIDSLYLGKKFDNYSKIVIAPGEESKSFESLNKLLGEFSKIGLKRNCLVVAIGGGVIGDLAGFAASIYMRGVDYWQVPTTLVAMVDSSIGGKTGINTEFGKNLIGSFYPPKKIVVDLNFAQKLPKSEVKNGLAEMYKHCLIENYNHLNNLISNPLSEKSVISSAKVKIKIIEKDPLEKNIRKYLNIGHTVGHAIEKESKLQIPHGMAVAIGIKIESKIAKKLGILNDQNYNKIISDLALLNLDFDYKIENLDKFVKLMASDKKNMSQKICFALVSTPGKKIVIVDLEPENVVKILSEI